MGEINFAWLAVWVLSPGWPSHKLQVCDFFRHLSEATAPGGRECGPCPDFASYILAFALQLRKITENLSQGNWKALGWSERDSLSRLGHCGRWSRLACGPLLPLAFALGDGVNPQSA